MIALTDVDVNPVDVVLPPGRTGHELEELDAVFVPRHRVEFLAREIVFASERHPLPPWIGDVWYIQLLYLQPVTCARKKISARFISSSQGFVIDDDNDF